MKKCMSNIATWKRTFVKTNHSSFFYILHVYLPIIIFFILIIFPNYKSNDNFMQKTIIRNMWNQCRTKEKKTINPHYSRNVFHFLWFLFLVLSFEDSLGWPRFPEQHWKKIQATGRMNLILWDSLFNSKRIALP